MLVEFQNETYTRENSTLPSKAQLKQSFVIRLRGFATRRKYFEVETYRKRKVKIDSRFRRYDYNRLEIFGHVSSFDRL